MRTYVCAPAAVLGGVRFARFCCGVLGCGVLCLGLCGCYLEPERLLKKHTLEYESTDLSPGLLAERMEDIDDHYTEPRTPGKVAYSLETSMASISQHNDFEALWRGARACAWLTRNSASRWEREDYARRGVALGREARTRTSHRVESFYYLALCEIALSEFSELDYAELLRSARNHLRIAIVLDANFDHCGPHRALGILLMSKDREHLLALESKGGKAGLPGAVEHLAKATEACPDYAANHLAYARASLLMSDYSTARAQLENVLVSRTPEDRSSEHQQWLEEANEILTTLQGK